MTYLKRLYKQACYLWIGLRAIDVSSMFTSSASRNPLVNNYRPLVKYLQYKWIWNSYNMQNIFAYACIVCCASHRSNKSDRTKFQVPKKDQASKQTDEEVQKKSAQECFDPGTETEVDSIEGVLAKVKHAVSESQHSTDNTLVSDISSVMWPYPTNFR